MDGHTVYPADYVADGIGRLERGDSHWISGPQRARGHNPVSRAIELALESPLGRGGSKKWGGDGAPGDEFELDTGVFGGVWRRQTLLDYGGWDERWDKNEDSELASRFLRRGERLICLPSMSADYAPRDTLTRPVAPVPRLRALPRPHRPPPSRLHAPLAPASPRRSSSTARWRSSRAASGPSPAQASGSMASRWWPPACRQPGRADHPGDAALVPVVLATMHGAHGVGELAGAVQYGPPWAALALAVGLRGAAERAAMDETAVFAPSLHSS